jgi:hypothetical protein
LRQKGPTSNHDLKLNAIVPVKKYLSEFTKRIPSISSHIFTQSSNATADPEDAVMTRAIVRAIAGGVILAPVFLWLQDSWYPLLFLLILIALDIFASVPLIKLPSDETGRARFWEVLMLFGFNIAVMWTIMYVVLPVLLVVCLIFGIQT